MMTCEAPNCNGKKRGPKYCNKHRMQIIKYGVLRQDLERKPNKNLRDLKK